MVARLESWPSVNVIYNDDYKNKYKFHFSFWVVLFYFVVAVVTMCNSGMLMTGLFQPEVKLVSYGSAAVGFHGNQQ